MRRRLLVASGAVLLAAVSGCATEPSGAPAPQSAVTDPIPVAANFYPVEWLVREIGGDAVTVTDLTPVGTEPHDLALTGAARTAMDDARVVFYLGSGFQPDVEKAVGELATGTTAVDLLTAPGMTLRDAGTDLGKEPLEGNKDPHVWLDPRLMEAMADVVTATLVTADPAHADQFESSRDTVVARLAALDDQLATELADCANRTIVTSHAAFGYLGDRYDLTQIPIAGVSPDDQPDPATLEQISDDARRAGVSTVFFEEQLPTDLAETVAAEIGAKVDLLSALEFDPASTGSPDADYVSVMQDNGARLAAGLTCR